VRQTVQEKVTLTADETFDFDSAVLKPGGKEALDGLVAKLANTEVDSIQVTGHTDSVGGDAYNDKLSLKRAEAVKAYLVSKGIAADKLHTAGAGKRQPVADNKTAEGRAKNRRVEVELAGSRTVQR
jgi:OOP family OmpA-OmpF porin